MWIFIFFHRMLGYAWLSVLTFLRIPDDHIRFALEKMIIFVQSDNVFVNSDCSAA